MIRQGLLVARYANDRDVHKDRRLDTVMRCTHSWTDDTATIGVAGIERPLRVLHVTDSHISVPLEAVDELCRPAQDVPVVGFSRSGEANPRQRRPYAHYGARMDGLFADYPTLQSWSPRRWTSAHASRLPT